MQTVVLIDVHDCRETFASFLGVTLDEATINPRQIVAIVDHPADALAYFDCHSGIGKLVVLSARSAATQDAGARNWGFGWRCGRQVDANWLAVAMQEGRIASAAWWQLTPDRIHRSLFGNAEDASDREYVRSLFKDDSTKFIVCRSKNGSKPRLRDAQQSRTDNQVRLWHGSSIGGLKRLTPNGRRLWISPSSAFAACFTVSPYTNLGFYQGIDRVFDVEPSVYVVVPPGFESILAQSCSLYEIAVPVAELREIGIQGYEFVAHREIDIRAERQYSSCNSALLEQGVQVVTMRTARPIHPDLAERCQPFRHSLEAFVGVPLEVAILIPCKVWALQFWLHARGLEGFDIQQAASLQRLLERIWLPAIARRSGLPEYGYHSLTHCMQVALLGALIAWKEAINPIPVAIAGLLHDTARQGDEESANHAIAALSLVDETIGRELRHLLSPRDLKSVRGAIAGHAGGKQSTDPIIGSCWDADRLRLAWERGVERKFFSTRTGIELACLGHKQTFMEASRVFGPQYFNEHLYS